MSLVEWLATRSPEQLAALMTARPEVFFGPPPRSLRNLAERLMTRQAVEMGVRSLTIAGRQVLIAAARLATSDLYAGGPPGTVRVEDLLVALGAAEAPREAAARAVLATLQDEMLIWPGPAGVLIVSGVVLDAFARRQPDEARPLDSGLSAAYHKEPITLIAEALGVGLATGTRPVLQAAIVTHLSDPATVRALVESAPRGANRLLNDLLRHGKRLGTHAFPRLNGLGAKYTINPDYRDQDTVWLATHGLIVPDAPDRAEIPAEILAALGARFPFTPDPPAVPTVPVAVERVNGQAQQAVATALTTMTALLDALDRQPVGLRKDGGFPVRETRRLAKHLRLSETETAFWIDLAHHAGLIGELPDHGSWVVCPTTESDEWRDLTATQRLSSLLRTWLAMDVIASFWPEGETPVPYGWSGDPWDQELRRIVLAALFALPPGVGCAPDPVAGPAGTVAVLTGVVSWADPHMAQVQPLTGPKISLTLREAELLGVLAVGAPSVVGRALVSGEGGALEAVLDALLPVERTTARFQADLTAIVAGIPSPRLAALLDSVAVRESEGHAVVYRLSATSIRRGLDAGAAPADLLTQLADVAEGTLPQPVRYLIADVGRTHGQMRVVRSGCCIRSDDESLVAELARAKGLAKLGLRQIAPTVVISAAPPAQTLAALRTAGYTPTLEAETGSTVVERAQPRRAKRTPRPAWDRHAIKEPLALARKLLSAPVENDWAAPTLV